MRAEARKSARMPRTTGIPLSAAAQIVLNCSNGCLQVAQWRSDLQGVGPKMFSRRVSVEPQYGQRWTLDWSCTRVGADVPRGAGGAKPEARSFSRPCGVMRSVDHESSRQTLIS